MPIPLPPYPPDAGGELAAVLASQKEEELSPAELLQHKCARFECAFLCTPASLAPLLARAPSPAVCRRARAHRRRLSAALVQPYQEQCELLDPFLGEAWRQK